MFWNGPKWSSSDAADHAGEQADRRAEEALANEVERLEVVAGMDVPLLEAGFVLGDDVDEEIVDADVMQVVRDPHGALELRRDVIETLHPYPRNGRRPSLAHTGARRRGNGGLVAMQNRLDRRQPVEGVGLDRECPRVGAAVAGHDLAEPIGVDHGLVTQQGDADPRRVL